MDYRVSRPSRWRAATRQALEARHRLHEMTLELIVKKDDLIEEWDSQRDKFENALSDLAEIQNEYEIMEEPENFSNTPFHEKRRNVIDLPIERMTGSIPSLTTLMAEIDLFLSEEDDFYYLNEARQMELPLGYGRD